MNKIIPFLLASLVNASTDEMTIQVTINNNSIDWVNLQWPSNGSIELGQEFNAYSQVYEPGITDSEGQGSNINGWVGYSDVNNDPSGPGWTWISAQYNSDSGNNDEYIADIGSAITQIGTYYYASRFSIDGGESYQYGGFSSTSGGFWDGQSNINGVLTVTGNNAPVLTPIADRAMVEDILTNISLEATDLDGDELLFSISGGSVETVLGTIDNSILTLTPATNYNTNESIQFTVTVSDGNGATDSDTFNITVSAVNDAPVIAGLSDQEGLEGEELAFTITASDVDGDDLSWTSSNLPSGASFTDNEDGSSSFTWTPTYMQAGIYSDILFIVDDGQGSRASIRVAPAKTKLSK